MSLESPIASGDIDAGIEVPPPRHRADYILERGVWRVSCRVCGWKDTDPVRRMLASRFRFHLQTGRREPPGTAAP